MSKAAPPALDISVHVGDRPRRPHSIALTPTVGDNVDNCLKSSLLSHFYLADVCSRIIIGRY